MMTDKPNVFREVFDEVLYPAPKPAPESPLVSDSEAHAKLKRNLDMALDVHKQAMSATLPDIPGGDKRLMVESANTTVKAALATDRTALKARSDNILERVLLRVIVVRKYHGREVAPKDVERLRATPRAELEAALGQRWLKEYDRMEF